MTGLDIEAIRAEFERARTDKVAPVSRLAKLGGQVPGLLDEIERLRAEVLEEQTVHAKTFDNFDAHMESCTEDRTRQLDRYARLDAQHDATVKAKEAVEQVCRELDAQLREAERDRDEARAERDDALQVLADLRSEFDIDHREGT